MLKEGVWAILRTGSSNRVKMHTKGAKCYNTGEGDKRNHKRELEAPKNVGGKEK